MGSKGHMGNLITSACGISYGIQSLETMGFVL